MQVRQMVKKTKIVQVRIFDASQADVESMVKALDSVKNSFGLDYEFLVTNEQIEMRDLKHLINELYELYKKTKNTKS